MTVMRDPISGVVLAMSCHECGQLRVPSRPAVQLASGRVLWACSVCWRARWCDVFCAEPQGMREPRQSL